MGLRGDEGRGDAVGSRPPLAPYYIAHACSKGEEKLIIMGLR